jgi:hypothetical protein
MDESIIANPGDIILIKINKEMGFYAEVIDVVADKMKKGFWAMRFYPFVQTPDWKIIEVTWLLDNDQIRGQEFTMNGVPHQLFKIEFQKLETIKQTQFDADGPVPLPRPKINSNKHNLKLVVNNQIHKTPNKKPNLTLVK